MKKINIEKLNLEEILRPIPDEEMHELSKKELIVLLKEEQRLRDFYRKLHNRREEYIEELKEEKMLVEGHYIKIKKMFFGKSSEKSPNNYPKGKSENTNNKNSKEKSTKKLSERYPNIPIIEKNVELEIVPNCSTCNNPMKDSGMVEPSEYLGKIPSQYYIIRQLRHKYCCGACYSNVKVAPNIPRIKPGSSYDDDLIIDSSMSKYCDLIPLGRYVKIAERQGLKNLPANSLIETSHYLANFTVNAYNKVLEEMLTENVLKADETPHNMLEGDRKSGWQLWGFSGKKGCYFECHNTRLATVSSNILKRSKCLFLLSDGYSGYIKSVNDINIIRKNEGLDLIQNAYCNAHCRRKFNDSKEKFSEANYYLEQYRKIYMIHKEFKINQNLEKLKEIKILFEEMKENAIKDQNSCSSKSIFGKALSYFIKYFKNLTLFIDNPIIDIDNNSQERSFRSPVLGRKTWYGTHSKRGAQTASQLFTLVESCKMNNVNPREYFKNLVKECTMS